MHFLENVTVLRELARTGQVDGGMLDFEQVRLNQARHSEEHGARSNSVGHLLFLGHEVMISRFHADLEVETMKRAGGVTLERWRQGTDLWDSIPPKYGHDSSLPFRPDAYFTWHFSGAQ